MEQGDRRQFHSCYLANAFLCHHSTLNPPFFLMQTGIRFYLETLGDYSKVLELGNGKLRPLVPSLSTAMFWLLSIPIVNQGLFK